jgi:iron complex transport system permease protein
MEKRRLLVGLLLFLLPVFFSLDLMLGSVSIPLTEIWNMILGGVADKKSWEIIIFDSRLPKALTAITCGVALSISGLQMQTLFRNPLAGPYILGISSGAGLGVAILTMGIQLFSIPVAYALSSWMVMLFSVLGSSLVLLLIFWASLRLKDIMTVLILGVMIGAIISAIVSLLQYFGSDAQLKSFVVWTFGSLDAVSMSQVSWLTAVVVLTLIPVAYQAKSLNILLMGEAYARTMGVQVKTSRMLIILTTGVLAGSVTAFCGPIGFIGIVVPHVCRLVFNTSDHRFLIPLSAMVGALLMLISDIISHLPGSDYILPINAITAIIGIPLILWMIFTKKVISSSF